MGCFLSFHWFLLVLILFTSCSMDWWRPHSCSNSKSLEDIPVVPYLCGEPSSLENKLNRTKVGNCKLKEINHPSECSSLVLPNYWSGERVCNGYFLQNLIRLSFSPFIHLYKENKKNFTLFNSKMIC